MKLLKQYLALLAFCLPLVCLSQVRHLQVEPNHSTVGFAIPIAGFSEVTGKFTDYQILLDWNDEDFSKSKISATIQASSINTGIPDRDDHLRTKDFFDVEKFPTITFESDSIHQIDFSHFLAYGKFSMHGLTKEIVLPFSVVKMDGNTIGFRSVTSLSRLEYAIGTEFNHTSMPDFLSDQINVKINFWTKKIKAEK